MKTHGLVYFRIAHVDSLGANDPSVSPPFLSERRIASRHIACQAKRKMTCPTWHERSRHAPKLSDDAVVEVGPCSAKNSPLSHGPFQVKYRATQPDDETSCRHGEGVIIKQLLRPDNIHSWSDAKKAVCPLARSSEATRFTSHSMPANRECISVLQQKWL